MPWRSHGFPLNTQQRQELESCLRRPQLPASIALRVRIVLMLSEGAPYEEIRRELQTSAPTIALWKSRFRTDGLAGLTTLRPGQPPKVLTGEIRERILHRTIQTPPGGAARWSLRMMATAVGVSKDIVRNVWRDAGISAQSSEGPHSCDWLDICEHEMDLIGIYLNSGQRLAVLSSGRPTQLRVPIQITTGSEMRRRMRAVALYAALNAQTYNTVSIAEADEQTEVRTFLAKLVTGHSDHERIHILFDCALVERNPVVKELSDRHRSVGFHFTSSSSWIRNLRVLLSRAWPKSPREATHTVGNLIEDNLQLIQRYSKIGKAFQWSCIPSFIAAKEKPQP